MSERILAPIDLSHESSWKSTLPKAFERAQQSEGSTVTVATVVPDIIAGLDWRYAIRGETGGSEEFDMQKIVEESAKRLENVVAEYAPPGMSVDTIARHGTIYEQILNIAEEIDATEILMAAHRPSLADYLIGPNTARVVRHAKCTVTVLRGT